MRSFLNLSKQELPRELIELADRVLQDPLLLRRLNERVYEIFLEDIRVTRDRVNGGRH